MSTEVPSDRSLIAALILAEHFLNDHAIPGANLSAAFEIMGAEREFEILGYACFMAMLRLDVERLKNRRAALLSKLGELPRPPVH